MQSRFLAATVVVLLCMSGCSKKSESGSSGSSNGPPAIEPLTGKPLAAAQLPEGWPSNVPVYPDAFIVSSFK